MSGAPPPPRSKHFGQSGFCVKRFDHFCYVLGAVVGEGNYRPFVLLLHCLVLFNAQAVPVILLGVLPARRLADASAGWSGCLLASPDALLGLCYAWM